MLPETLDRSVITGEELRTSQFSLRVKVVLEKIRVHEHDCAGGDADAVVDVDAVVEVEERREYRGTRSPLMVGKHAGGLSGATSYTQNQSRRG
jgi:hypothetical protein